MTSKSKFFVFMITLFIVAVINVRTVLNSNYSYDLAITSIEAISSGNGDNDENIDGEVELPEFGVTCDKGKSGRCYKMGYMEGLYGVCYFFCKATGDPKDYCSSLYVDFVNLCTMIGGV